MPIELPVDLTPELVPLSWLIGRWEGTGVAAQDDDAVGGGVPFFQRIEFADRGLPYLIYTNETWVIDDHGNQLRPLSAETGFWQLDRSFTDKDEGPGMRPGSAEHTLAGVDDVEKLRNAEGGFDLLVTIARPGGVNELYLGKIKGPRIDLVTDAVVRSAGAKEFRESSRMYGLVEGDLLWAWDIARGEDPLASHASGRLSRVADGSSFEQAPEAASVDDDVESPAVDFSADAGTESGTDEN